MTNQQVVNFIRKEIANYIPLKEICEHIMDHCLSDVGDTTKVGCDNMTILIVALLQGREEKKWYEYIASQHLDDTPINLCIRSESREYSLSELSHAPDITKDLLDD
jgi:serine/threonine protein phosphatase PrpC